MTRPPSLDPLTVLDWRIRAHAAAIDAWTARAAVVVIAFAAAVFGAGCLPAVMLP